LALLTGAVLTLAPTSYVADDHWLGFDRYLYVPAMLVSFGAITLFHPREVVPMNSRRCLVPVATAIVLAVPLWAQARIYHSHASWVVAMTTFQPESPITRLHAARLALANGDRDSAIALADLLAEDDLTPSLRHSVANLEIDLGRYERAGAHVEAAYAVAPDAPTVRFDLLTWRVIQGRWDEALDLAEGLVDVPSMCPTVQQLARSWIDQRQLPPRHVERLRVRVLDRPCGS
jgi:hypothetical protein